MGSKKVYFIELNTPRSKEDLLRQGPKSRWVPQAGNYNSLYEAIQAAHNLNYYPYRIQTVNEYMKEN